MAGRFSSLFGQKRARLAYVHDVIMAGVSLAASMYLRVGMDAFGFYRDTLLVGVPLFMAIAAVAFRLFGMNSGVWRYASTRDLSAIIKSVTAALLVFLPTMFLVSRLSAMPRSVPLIDWFVLTVLLSAPRLAYRLLKDRRIGSLIERDDHMRVPVLLAGAGDMAELFIRAMAKDPTAAYRVVGALDEKGRRVGLEIHGVRVLGTLDALEETTRTLTARGDAPQRLIVTKTGAPFVGAEMRHLVDRAQALGMTVARLPTLADLRTDDGSGGGPEPRPIALEDLLGRPQVALDRSLVGRMVAGRTVLVTGAGGTIGSELTRQIASYGPARLVLVDNGEFNLYSIDLEVRTAFPALDIRPTLCDVRDRGRLMRLFAAERPALVFHAAALKHVPMVEYNPCEGVLTNALGTVNVADAAAQHGAEAMVLISTDKAINPSSVMGATKRIAECYCQALDAEDRSGMRFMTVRFGNVLGSTGSVVPLFERQLRAGGPLTVTHPEMRRYFMTVHEAVELVLQASAYGVAKRDRRGRIFVLDMGEPVLIADLARQMIRLAGLRPDEDVRIAFTGLRPGEKLFEEMFDPAEPPERTEAEGVFMAAPRAVDPGILRRTLSDLSVAAGAGDETRVRALIGHLVPEYRAPTLEDVARI